MQNTLLKLGFQKSNDELYIWFQENELKLQMSYEDSKWTLYVFENGNKLKLNSNVDEEFVTNLMDEVNKYDEL